MNNSLHHLSFDVRSSFEHFNWWLLSSSLCLTPPHSYWTLGGLIFPKFLSSWTFHVPQAIWWALPLSDMWSRIWQWKRTFLSNFFYIDHHHMTSAEWKVLELRNFGKIDLPSVHHSIYPLPPLPPTNRPTPHLLKRSHLHPTPHTSPPSLSSPSRNKIPAASKKFSLQTETDL